MKRRAIQRFLEKPKEAVREFPSKGMFVRSSSGGFVIANDFVKWKVI